MNVTELEYVDGLRIMYKDAFNSAKNGGLMETGCPSALFVKFNSSAASDFPPGWGEYDLPGEYSYDATLGYWVGKILDYDAGWAGIWNKTFGDQQERDGKEMNWCIGYVYDYGSMKQYSCNVYNPSKVNCPHEAVSKWAFLVEIYKHQQLEPSAFQVKKNGGNYMCFKNLSIKPILNKAII